MAILMCLTASGSQLIKASSKINLNKDISVGFNCTLKWGNVTHHEYIQASKERNLGLNQIAVFESKIAGGNGEQVLSRDVYRLDHHLDFFRMLSFYYTTIGFFISNMMVVLTVYAVVWDRVYIALSGLKCSFTRQLALTTRGSKLIVTGQNPFTNKLALTVSLKQQFIVQLGIFIVLPMIVKNSIEHGLTSAIVDFLTMQMQLGSVFFKFSIGTRAHYFGRTLLHGGVGGYGTTGCGFVLQHENFMGYTCYLHGAISSRGWSSSFFLSFISVLVQLQLLAPQPMFPLLSPASP